MRGFPKHLNSKEDYEFIKAHFPKEQWKPAFELLLKSRKEWFNLGETTEGVNDETHKVVEDKENGKKYQFELKDNPSCTMYRIGYTEEEVKKILEEN